MYHQPKNNSACSGFTLIEVLVYLALFGVLMGGLLGAGYSIIESSGRNEAEVRMQEEGDFIAEKFSYGLAGANSFTVAQNPPTLTISKNNFPKNPLVFTASSTFVLLSEAGGLPLPLNDGAMNVTGLAFSHIAAASSSPEGVAIAFTLSSKTSAGRAISQNFNLTRFLQP